MFAGAAADDEDVHGGQPNGPEPRGLVRAAKAEGHRRRAFLQPPDGPVGPGGHRAGPTRSSHPFVAPLRLTRW
ncbi:hypothetical protein Saso_36290 [Streptomyces asoensis]|uniref:Uncharacterized protein n=1 Tax=Streptomyces asoensis TaxID=249586 RepID=A0ABQ3S1J0_9ACTN|nr:hypothetical protein GCM10010496_43680 [Streptomyces asoensis]GHI61979.1 hypothetical protein Saso_36290 [Streptomyces asoensis]